MSFTFIIIDNNLYFNWSETSHIFKLKHGLQHNNLQNNYTIIYTIYTIYTIIYRTFVRKYLKYMSFKFIILDKNLCFNWSETSHIFT